MASCIGPNKAWATPSLGLVPVFRQASLPLSQKSPIREWELLTCKFYRGASTWMISTCWIHLQHKTLMGIHHSLKITPRHSLWYFTILDRAVESRFRVWNYCPRSGVLTHVWFVAISPYFAIMVSRGWHLYPIKIVPQLRSPGTAKAHHSAFI